MLHRVSKVAFGGMWVFPAARWTTTTASRATTRPAPGAAAREAMEECGLAVDPDLVVASHWVPPAITPRRFSTHFFLARAGDGEVTVDGGEIHEHEWLAAREVLDRRDRGEVDLAPPTWVTLHELAEHDTVDEALRAAARRPDPHYETRWVTIDGGAVAMWAGDGLREQRSRPARCAPPALDAHGRLAARTVLTGLTPRRGSLEPPIDQPAGDAHPGRDHREVVGAEPLGVHDLGLVDHDVTAAHVASNPIISECGNGHGWLAM